MEYGDCLLVSSDSFVMIRGGHIDLAIMGALQIDQFGEIANCAIPGKDILGVGGAMDLVAGANRIIIASMHQAKDETPKLVDKLSFQRIGKGKAYRQVYEQESSKLPTMATS